MKVWGLFLYALLRNGIPKTMEKYQKEGTAHLPRVLMWLNPARTRLFPRWDVPGAAEHFRERYSPSWQTANRAVK